MMKTSFEVAPMRIPIKDMHHKSSKSSNMSSIVNIHIDNNKVKTADKSTKRSISNNTNKIDLPKLPLHNNMDMSVGGDDLMIPSSKTGENEAS